MLKLLLPIVAVLAVGMSVAGASVYVLTRDDTPDQAPQAQATATPTAMPTPSPTAEPTPTPAGDGWVTYTDPGGRFTIRYPETWFESGGSFYSRDPATFKGGPDLPPDVVEVEVGYYPDDGVSGCGVLSVDPTTGEVSPEAGATPVKLDDASAWRVVKVQGGEQPIEENLTRIEAISVIYKGYCFNIAAYFTGESPDEAIFSEIAGTFKFEF